MDSVIGFFAHYWPLLLAVSTVAGVIYLVELALAENDEGET